MICFYAWIVEIWLFQIRPRALSDVVLNIIPDDFQSDLSLNNVEFYPTFRRRRRKRRIGRICPRSNVNNALFLIFFLPLSFDRNSFGSDWKTSKLIHMQYADVLLSIHTGVWWWHILIMLGTTKVIKNLKSWKSRVLNHACFWTLGEKWSTTLYIC